jgi:hypothetical protein
LPGARTRQSRSIISSAVVAAAWLIGLSALHPMPCEVWRSAPILGLPILLKSPPYQCGRSYRCRAGFPPRSDPCGR